jgi:uncharacterized protein (TIGR03086 family)
MSEIADRYRKNAGAFDACVTAVPDDRWENRSPCDEWNARQVVGHVVDTSGMFLGYIDEKLPPAPSVDDDPAAAFQSARAAIQSALDDPTRAQKEYDGFFGKTTFEQSVDRFLSPDALMHAWDLAKATGLETPVDNEEAKRLLENYSQMGDTVRTAGVFGPAMEAPENADPMTKLLAFSGRQP